MATENYCVGLTGEDCVGTDFTYGAGDFEQGRNVSQLIGNKITILDPRYTPSGGLKLYPTIRTDWLDTNELPWTDLPYPDDGTDEWPRDSSKFFMIYETGDNTTVAEGEAIPLNLYYSRATVFGDVWELDPDWYDEDTGEILDYRWNWLENKKDDLSGEASMLTNPGGTFMYTVWNQWKEEIGDDGHELVYDSDIIFRRLLYIPDWSTQELQPLASILYYSPSAAGHNIGGDLVLMGTARDLDHLGDGIVAYRWSSSIDGIMGTDKYLIIPVQDLSVGLHTISFTAQDNEGNWAPEASIRLLVAEELTFTFTPMIVR
jgi:hypothetical protein